MQTSPIVPGETLHGTYEMLTVHALRTATERKNNNIFWQQGKWDHGMKQSQRERERETQRDRDTERRRHREKETKRERERKKERKKGRKEERKKEVRGSTMPSDVSTLRVLCVASSNRLLRVHEESQATFQMWQKKCAFLRHYNEESHQYAEASSCAIWNEINIIRSSRICSMIHFSAPLLSTLAIHSLSSTYQIELSKQHVATPASHTLLRCRFSRRLEAADASILFCANGTKPEPDITWGTTRSTRTNH